jgi:hypothetical protein
VSRARLVRFFPATSLVASSGPTGRVLPVGSYRSGPTGRVLPVGSYRSGPTGRVLPVAFSACSASVWFTGG